MIRVLCLNPVVDKIYHIDNFKAGNKFKETVPEVYAGGKGVNIARVLDCLEVKCVLYAFVGGGSGEVIRKGTESVNINRRLVAISGETRTTVNIIDGATELETEITEHGPEVQPEQRDALIHQLVQEITPGDIVVCAGVTINGVGRDVYKYISGICSEKKAQCIIDTSKQALKDSLPGFYFFAKPNIKELEEFFGLAGETTRSEAVELCTKMRCNGIENILLSLGEEGALLIRENEVLSLAPPSIEKICTVGSGDAAVAGVCAGLNDGRSIEECVRLAMACGAANAACAGIGFVEKKRVEDYYNRVTVTPFPVKRDG